MQQSKLFGENDQMKALHRIVERKIAIMFPDPAVRRRIEKEVYQYGQQGEPEVERVRLAILKLSGGQPDNINVAGAMEDSEDTIAWAERPEWMNAGMANRKLKPEEQEQIDARDWEQYHDWLAQGLK